MTDFPARIRRVRMKDGADVHVLYSTAPNSDEGQPENFRGTIVQHAKMIAEYQPHSDMIGFAVVAFWSGGGHSAGWRLQDCNLPLSAFPHAVGEVMRTEVMTAPRARREFDDKFEWVE